MEKRQNTRKNNYKRVFNYMTKELQTREKGKRNIFLAQKYENLFKVKKTERGWFLEFVDAKEAKEKGIYDIYKQQRKQFLEDINLASVGTTKKDAMNLLKQIEKEHERELRERYEKRGGEEYADVMLASKEWSSEEWRMMIELKETGITSRESIELVNLIINDSEENRAKVRKIVKNRKELERKVRDVVGDLELNEIKNFVEKIEDFEDAKISDALKGRF